MAHWKREGREGKRFGELGYVVEVLVIDEWDEVVGEFVESMMRSGMGNGLCESCCLV